MILFSPDAIGLIFVGIPLMIVVMSLVMVASVLVIFSSQTRWCHCYWNYQGGAKEGRFPETGHEYSPCRCAAIVRPNPRWTRGHLSTTQMADLARRFSGSDGWL